MENTGKVKYKNLFYKMLRIRMVEEEIARRYSQKKMRCPTHLSIGQEAVAVAVGENLFATDFAVSSHRAHAHYLAKGGNLSALIAEIYGKATGCAGGYGGSMHLSDLTVGFVASTAIVANTVPLGVGLSFSQVLKKQNAITCIFIGDAAIEEGVFYESLNFAVLKKLPVLFICENNLYSVNTPLHLRQPIERPIFKLAHGIGAKAEQFDGNDIVSMFDTVYKVIKDLRNQGGPWFLEFHTYRYKVHCGPEDDLNYNARPKEEIDYWLARDPVSLLQSKLLELSFLSLKEIDSYKQKIQEEINKAFDFAENSLFPSINDKYKFQYIDNNLEWLHSVLNPQKEVYTIE